MLSSSVVSICQTRLTTVFTRKQGTYSPLPAATACLTCPNGTEAPFFGGATACIDCAVQLCRCPDGQYNRSSGECAPCSARCADNGSYIAEACAPQSDIVCAPCRSGGSCDDGYFMSAACSVYADTVCTPCRSSCAGFFYVAGACTAFADAPCAPCSARCPNNSFSIAPCGGASDLACELCPPATFTDDGGACRACDAGSVFVLNGGCVRCPDGDYSNANRTACVPRCPPGEPALSLSL